MLIENVSETFKEKFEPLLVQTMTQNHIPGLSIALVREGQIIYAKGFGARNLAKNLPATPKTLFGVGSVTKSFTALAIMQLVEQDKLALNDPVQTHLPVKLEPSITLHHLLSHTSGLPGLGTSEIRISRMFGTDEKWIPMSSWDDLFAHVNGAAKSAIAAPPGERFFYCNAGYLLLGNIIERVSGIKYATYIKEKILTPLKMNRSTFLQADVKDDPDLMTPYLITDKDGQMVATATQHPYTPLSYSVGGLLTSVMELSNYLMAMMNSGVFEDNSLVDSSLLKQMHTPQTNSIKLNRLGSVYAPEGYGYGWMTADFYGHKLIHHAGSTGASSGFLMFLPDLKIGLAYASNIGESPRAVLLGALAFLLEKDPLKDFPYFQMDQQLNQLCGVYEAYKGFFKLKVVKKGGLLYLESTQKLMEMSVPLIPTSETLETLRFYMSTAPGEKWFVDFTVEDGTVELYMDFFWHLRKVS